MWPQREPCRRSVVFLDVPAMAPFLKVCHSTSFRPKRNSAKSGSTLSAMMLAPHFQVCAFEAFLYAVNIIFNLHCSFVF